MALQSITISNHPATGNIRKVDVDKIIINGGERRVTMACTVRQYDSQGAEILPAYPISLNATDQHMVDAQGNVVAEGGIMTEYEYYMMLRGIDVTQEQLEQAAVATADASGRFNI